MLSEKMRDALNGQINAEIYSAYLYLSMAASLDSKNLPGFANWMKAQAQEEMIHAMKIYDYVVQSDGKVQLAAIDNPPSQWQSPMATFEAVYKHEQKVTALINDLVKLAIEQNDDATNGFLQWFVKEQVEEEESADEIVQKLKTADSPEKLSAVNDELGQRAFK